MRRKGQFLIISAIVAGVIIISLSASVNRIQNQRYETSNLPDHINKLEREIKRITEDGAITQQEKRNFRKLTSYIESYRTSVDFRTTGPVPCIQVTLKSTDSTAQMPCLS